MGGQNSALREGTAKADGLGNWDLGVIVAVEYYMYQKKMFYGLMSWS